jgi:hypothetical protein
MTWLPLLLFIAASVFPHHCKALGGGYERLLGGKSVHKYCGETNDECMFNNQCCDGYSCEFDDGGYDGRCYLQRGSYRTGGFDGDDYLSEEAERQCFSNLDCRYDECCQPASTLSDQYRQVCKKTCHLSTSRGRVMPAVGNYQGYNFWQKWQRRSKAKRET